jgi:membrane protein YqaA with SNARE-associated domain
MSGLTLYAGLFLSAFLSATLLPGSSEAALIALLAAEQGNPAGLVSVATVGNVLGSLVNWVLGRFFAHYRDRCWFPVDQKTYERAIGWYQRYGVWSLLFAWLPVVGDPLTLIAGVMRADVRVFLLLVAAGKFARYLVIAGAFAWWAGN